MGTLAAVTSAYAFRDKTLDDLHNRVEKTVVQVRSERQESLKHYLTKEGFSEWRQQERIRQDAQFYRLLNAIERLSDRVGKR